MHLGSSSSDGMGLSNAHPGRHIRKYFSEHREKELPLSEYLLCPDILMSQVTLVCGQQTTNDPEDARKLPVRSRSLKLGTELYLSPHYSRSQNISDT